MFVVQNLGCLNFWKPDFFGCLNSSLNSSELVWISLQTLTLSIKRTQIDVFNEIVIQFSVSLFSYLSSEVTRGYVLDHDEERYTTRRQKMYTFMKIPRELEKFMSYGFFHCLVRPPYNHANEKDCTRTIRWRTFHPTRTVHCRTAHRRSCHLCS